MTRVQLTVRRTLVVFGAFLVSAASLHAQSKEEPQKAATAGSPVQDASERYAELLKLRSTRELPDHVLSQVIDCLDDLRGYAPGNTIAGEAAEVLAEHPRQAVRAIPHLLKLLSYKEKYGYPSGSAAKALAAIERPALEKYLSALVAGDRKALAESLIPVLGSEAGSLAGWAVVAEIIGMLGTDASDAIPTLQAKAERFKSEKESNPFARVLLVRTGSAIRLISGELTVGDSGYYDEMKRADTAVGKPDPYVLPENRFVAALETLIQRMKGVSVKRAYILRTDATFPFRLSRGLPLARLVQNTGYRYLYGGDDGKGKQLPNVPLIVLTRSSKRVYQSLHNPTMDPPYSPLVPDFAFIEMGVNGHAPLDQALKSVGVAEGYDEDSMYEFWPAEWWPSMGTLHGEFRIGEDVEAIWLTIEGGRVLNVAYVKNE